MNTHEDVSATRDRFTMQTTTSSDPNWIRDTGKAFALLFKALWQLEAKLRTELRYPETVYVQTCESGSYRADNICDLLDWALPNYTPFNPPKKHKGSKPTLVAVILDWFAAHHCEDTRALLHKKGCMRIMLGGGLTAIVQGNDTHLHKPLNAYWRNLEVREAARTTDIRRHSLAAKSRQAVLNRAVGAWGQCDHEAISNSYWHNGIANGLDGKEDKTLNRTCAEYWTELNMDEHRERSKQIVKGMVERKEITHISQYEQVLEAYDDHAYTPDHMEGATVEVVDEDDHVFLEGFESEVEDEAQEATPAGAGLEANDGATAPATGLQANEAAAEVDIVALEDGKRLQGLRAALEVLRASGNNAQAEPVAAELFNLTRKHATMSLRARTFLRKRALDRTEELNKLAKEAAADDAAMARLNKEIKLKALEVEKAKAHSQHEGHVARAQLIELKKKKCELAEEKSEKEKDEARRSEAAACNMDALRAGVQAGKKMAKVAHESLSRSAKARSQLKPWKEDVLVPRFWQPSSYGKVPVYGSSAVGASKKKRADVFFASPKFRHNFFMGGAQTKPMLDTFQHHVRAVMPRYNEVTGNRWPLVDTIEECKRDLDVAWLTTVWRYSHMMTPSAFPQGLFSWPPSPTSGSNPTTSETGPSSKSTSASSGSKPAVVKVS